MLVENVMLIKGQKTYTSCITFYLTEKYGFYKTFKFINSFVHPQEYRNIDKVNFGYRHVGLEILSNICIS